MGMRFKSCFCCIFSSACLLLPNHLPLTPPSCHPMDCSLQVLLSVEFSEQEDWVGCHFLLPGEAVFKSSHSFGL